MSLLSNASSGVGVVSSGSAEAEGPAACGPLAPAAAGLETLSRLILHGGSATTANYTDFSFANFLTSAVQHGVPCVVLAGQVSVGRREAAAVGVDAAYALADVSRDALVALAERVARRWGR